LFSSSYMPMRHDTMLSNGRRGGFNYRDHGYYCGDLYPCHHGYYRCYVYPRHHRYNSGDIYPRNNCDHGCYVYPRNHRDYSYYRCFGDYFHYWYLWMSRHRYYYGCFHLFWWRSNRHNREELRNCCNLKSNFVYLWVSKRF